MFIGLAFHSIGDAVVEKLGATHGIYSLQDGAPFVQPQHDVQPFALGLTQCNRPMIARSTLLFDEGADGSTKLEGQENLFAGSLFHVSSLSF
jgi:hypothetical protein